MPVINRITEFAADMKAWRRDIHQHPELAFEEDRTADVVAAKLEDWGIEVHRGLAKTGVVGLLKGQSDSGRMIGLRADLDALPMQETNDFDHTSVHDGKMHACGHDGHTTMLLGAARYLAETKNFDGRIAFIFQPAEENFGGGKVMVEEGLFDLFPCESVYGMHNMPGLPAGQAALREGSILAASDEAYITVRGQGGHAAMPHTTNDPVPIAAQMITALQTVASRRSNPLDSVVVSVTCIHAGTIVNVIPETVELSLSIRTLRRDTRNWIEAEIRKIAEGIAAANGASAEIRYHKGYPATVNTGPETEHCAKVAREVVGEDNVVMGVEPRMGSEDFAYMLEKKPGCYILLGNGDASGESGCYLHNPGYDFNDEIAVVGASYWARLAETLLPRM